MNAVERIIERQFSRPKIVECWKCGALNEVRADLVQFDCRECDSTNYARNGRWPNDPFPEVTGLA